jgi:Protein of unknown function (DUF1566)
MKTTVLGMVVILGVLIQSMAFAQSVKASKSSAAFAQTIGNPKCTFFDGFIDKKDGVLIDPRTNLMWKRCAEGSEWNGTSCSGTPAKREWLDTARAIKNSTFLGQSGWRLPTYQELTSIVGDQGTEAAPVCRQNEGKNDQFAVSSKFLNRNADLARYSYTVWSSTPSPADGILYVLKANFTLGHSAKTSPERDDSLRTEGGEWTYTHLVRDGSSVSALTSEDEARYQSSANANLERANRRLEQLRQSNNDSSRNDSSRNGVRSLETLSWDGASVTCNNGHSQVISRVRGGQWTGGDKDRVWRGFDSATQLAFHVCR